MKQIIPDKAIAYYNIANHSANERNYSNALFYYTEALKIYSFYEAFFNRGITYAELGDYENAIKDYENAIELNKNDYEVFYALGNSQKKLKQYEKAIKSYIESIKLNPGFTSAYNNKGNIYMELKDYKKALSDFKQILLMNPKDRKALTMVMHIEKILYRNNK